METTRTAKPHSAPVHDRGRAFFNPSVGAFFSPGTHYRVQAKLTVGKANDSFEKEADQVAERVVRPAQHPENGVSTATAPPSIQKMCAQCGDEEELQRQEDGVSLQRQTSDEHADETNTDGIESVLNSSGHALADGTRSFMESQFQRDFSLVRIHTDSRAADSARSINAKAYTSGNDIVFGAGHYQPGTQEGKKLLAHELTHTVQQGANASTVQRTLLTCEQGEDCPPRSSGENTWAASHGIRVENITAPEAGLLVWGFPVDSASARGLGSQPSWRSFVADLNSRETYWQVRGFSDCQGSETRNEDLRDERALSARNAVPATERLKVIAVYGAAMDQCIASNSTRDGRAHNRAAFFQVFSSPHGPEQDRAPQEAPAPDEAAAPESELPLPDVPDECSPAVARRAAEGCTPNPHGAHLPPVGGTHTESHPHEPCLLTERVVLASADWCVDIHQAHGGERCYRQKPTTAGGPGDQYCFSENCCHNSRDVVSMVDTGSPGAGQCCNEDNSELPGHIWHDYIPELIDDPVRVIRDSFGL